MALRYDASRLAKARKTAQGYVRVDSNLSRVGVLTYRNPDGTPRRELRHPDDVFAPAALETADAGVPVTIGHPGLLTPANTKQHRVGGTAAAAVRNGQFLSAPLQIEDADAIARVDSGELSELSAGYLVEYDPTPGVWEGQRYDGRQTQIRLNHIALLPAGGGRSGATVGLRLDAADAVCEDLEDSQATPPGTSKPMAKIRIDSVDVEVSEDVAKFVTTQAEKLAAAEKAQGKAESELVDANKRLDAALDPKALDARVAERVQLEASARKVLGPEYSAAGKTAKQVHLETLAKARPEIKFDSRSDDYLAGQFEAVCVSGPAGKDAVTRELELVKKPVVPGTRTDATDENDPDAAYQAAVKARSTQWKGKDK